MKKLIQFKLKILSKLILGKYKPDVIGITGSVGKTSTKTAVYTLLEGTYPVRASQKNYNTETGVPLTIIGADNPGHSILGWLAVFFKGFWLLIKRDKDYPKVLILEMAADHPGDIKYLVKFTKPKIGVITSVGPTHLEFFDTVAKVGAEKANMISNLNEDSFAVVNTDQEILERLSKQTKAKLISFGLNGTDLTAENIELNKEQGGLTFVLKYQQTSTKVAIPNLLGKPAIYSLLAAAAVGICYDLPITKIAAKLKNYQPLPGRLNLLPGIKYTRLIDDSYNSSPLAVSAALEILSYLKCTGKKFAVLGDMLELGDHTQREHQKIGVEVVKRKIDYLVTVGERSSDMALAAKEYGMNPDRIYTFDNSLEAGKFLQDKIGEGDLILIKGSAGMSMEKITKEIMAEPDRARELLVRQD